MIEVIIMGEVRPGVFEFVVDGCPNGLLSGQSRQPLLDAARLALAEGVAKDREIRLARSQGAPADLTSTIGYASSKTIAEGDAGMSLRNWRPFGGIVE